MLLWNILLVLGSTMSQTKALKFKGEIPIGAIFDRQSDVYARTGYQYAISSVNRRAKGGIKFSTVYDELDILDNFKVASRICSQMAGGVFAFYGKTAMRSFSIIQSFSKAFQMPYLSFSLSGTADGMEKPYVLFMKPSYTDALADVIIGFGWSRLDYIYDSDDGLMRVQYIYNKLKEQGHTTDIGFRRIDDIDHAHDELRRLDRRDTHFLKNVVLDLSSQQAYRKLLRQIPEVGMNRYGYNYLMATLDMLSLNLTRFRHGGVNITAFQLVNHSSSTVEKFLPEWRSLEESVWPGAGRDFVEIDAALSVDSVEAMRRALSDMIKRDTKVFHYTFRRGIIYNYNKTRGIKCNERPVLPWMHGIDIFNALKRVQFDGLTGRVAFDNRGFRRDYSLDILTVSLDHGPEKIGEWSSYNGIKSIYEAEEEMDWDNTTTMIMKTVVTILTPPFLMRKNTSSNGVPLTGNDMFEGYCKDLADEIQRRLKISYVFKIVKEYGKKHENGSWDGMIGELRRGVMSDRCPATG